MKDYYEIRHRDHPGITLWVPVGPTCRYPNGELCGYLVKEEGHLPRCKLFPIDSEVLRSQVISMKSGWCLQACKEAKVEEMAGGALAMKRRAKNRD